MRYAHTPTGCAICPLCERLYNLTAAGRLPAHRAWHVNGAGRPYRTEDRCPAAGTAPQEAAT